MIIAPKTLLFRHSFPMLFSIYKRCFEVIDEPFVFYATLVFYTAGSNITMVLKAEKTLT
jgi:hypothetical protein